MRHGSRIGFALTAALALGFGACGSDKSESPGGTGGFVATGGVLGSGATTASGGAFNTPGNGGLPGATGSSTSAGGAAAACKPDGQSCNDSLDCCEGSTCNNTAQAPDLNGCHKRCAGNSECSSGCCVLFTGDTRGICGDPKWCGCGMAGTICGSQQPQCCDDHVCLASNPQQSAYDCKKKCQKNADCPTNCCVAIPNLNTSACLDSSYCPAPSP